MTPWTSTALKDVATLVSGGTPSRNNPRYWGGQVPWITCKDMKADRLGDSAERLTVAGLEAGSRLVPAGAVLVAPVRTVQRLTLKGGDVLFNWRNSSELIGKSAVFEEQPEPHVFASFILRIRCDEVRSHNAFLAYLGRSDVRASDCTIESLHVVADPILPPNEPYNPNHANIAGFPPAKADQKALAILIAHKASKRIVPPEGA